MPISVRTFFYLTVDSFLLVICFINAPTVLERPRVPFQVEMIERSVIVTKIDNAVSAGDLHPGDQIQIWETDAITLPEMLESLGDLSSVDQRISIIYKRGGAVSTAVVSLVPYYDSPRFLIVTLCVGVITWAIGIFVLMYRSRNPAAAILHWALIALAVSVMLTWGRIDPASPFSFLARGLFFASYTLIPTLFFLFTIKYPRDKRTVFSRYSFLVFLPAAALIAGQTYHHLEAIRLSSVQSFSAFQQWFNLFNMYLIVMFGAMVFNLISSYRSAARADEKRRLEWILWGFCISPVPFLLLIKLPQLFGTATVPIPEEYTTIFFLLVPFSFAVSLVKYTILDIQLIINRSIVYGALTFFIGVVYVLTVLLGATFVDTERAFKEYFFIGIVILLTGLAFNPLRRRMQQTLDELLFPARAAFRSTVAGFRESLRRCLTAGEVYRELLDSLQKGISFESLAVYEHSRGLFSLKASKGTDHPSTLSIDEKLLSFLSRNKIHALHTALEFQRGDISTGAEAFLERAGCSIGTPLIDGSETLLGIVACTPGTVSRRFNEEEIDLLKILCTESAETLSRLLIQEQVIIQNEEKKRLEELSRLKSYFVSSVSHELRTPLTSIRMFAERLRSSRTLPPRKRSEYLHIIQGESERLSRLVDNVLDFAKIERGEEDFHFTQVDIADVVRRAGYAVQYQFEKEHMTLKVAVQKNIPGFFADPDALEEVVINLLSNALKYSAGPSLRGKKRSVRLRVKRVKRSIVIEVSDRGIGIPENELKNIFEKFYRVRDERLRQAGGAGLGLALVKHIVEAHGGDVRVQSIVGKGSTFTILLPWKQRK